MLAHQARGLNHVLPRNRIQDQQMLLCLRLALWPFGSLLVQDMRTFINEVKSRTL
jgi:hypothetical protein